MLERLMLILTLNNEARQIRWIEQSSKLTNYISERFSTEINFENYCSQINL